MTFLPFLLLLLAFQGPQIPAPTGYVNDFANVIPAGGRATLQRIADDVRAKSGGEIVVVTLQDLAGRDVSDIALRIGREWKVGAAAAIGERTRNTGAVILIVPKETAADGRGRCWVATGSGTEGFVTDATAGTACREAVPLFQQRDYGGGTVLVAYRVAEHFAREFGFQLDSSVAALAPVERAPEPFPSGGGGLSPGTLLFIFIVLILLMNSLGGGRRGRRRRRGCAAPIPIMIPWGGMSRGGGWGGGWSGGGGGFGGFGGGGGFSGGGGGSSW